MTRPACFQEARCSSSAGTCDSPFVACWRCLRIRERSCQNASSCSSVISLVCSLTFSAPRCFISTQSNVFAFITDHLQGRENANVGISLQCVDSIIQGNLLKVHDMLKVPAHDERTAGSCCNGHVERIVRPL